MRAAKEAELCFRELKNSATLRKARQKHFESNPFKETDFDVRRLLQRLVIAWLLIFPFSDGASALLFFRPALTSFR